MPRYRFTILLCAFLIPFVLPSCTSGSQPSEGPEDPPSIPVFDRNQAFSSLQQQCDFGARIPGSQAHDDCLAWIVQKLGETADTVVEQDFSASTPFGGPYNFTNVIAYYPGDNTQDPIMLGAHWDCRPKADADPDVTKRNLPVMGANDGASGVAVLLELGRVCQANQNRPPIILAFFDAEDSGQVGATTFEHDGWIIGSTYMSRHMPTGIPIPAAVIVLDLVGQDTDHNDRIGTPNGSNDYLDFPVESHSLQNAPTLVNAIWTAAETAGNTAFVRDNRGYITDDHLPFIEQGIPAVDIIDLPHPEWHTADDTPDCCSADSLYQVGDTMIKYLYRDAL